MSEYRSHFEASDPEEASVDSYRTLSLLAVFSFLLGLASPLLLLSILWGIAPLCSILLGYIALKQIRYSDGGLTGRWLAKCGCFLSLFFLVMVPTQWIVHRQLVRAEAKRFTAHVLEMLKQEEITEYSRLQRSPFSRPESLSLGSLIGNQFAREDFVGMLQQPALRTLLNLKGHWEYQYYATEYQTVDQSERDYIVQSFAINWDDNGETRTFFVDVKAARSEDPKLGKAGWQVTDLMGGVRPVAQGGDTPRI
ncbi:MAG: hypothetical protein PHE53_00400 [Thermoguttaceae bacterium]|nr:hypothetical protein [Thermoguttaceae bacterium]